MHAMRRHAAAIAAIAVVAGGIFVNALGSEFLWDDEYVIVENLHIRDPRRAMTCFGLGYWRELRAPRGPMLPTSRAYRPVAELSFALDYALWRLNPTGYHLTNVLLHIAACLLVYFFAYRIFGHSRPAALCALLFAAHPIHVEAVVWAKARAAPLALLLLLLSALLYLRWADSLLAPRRAWLQLCAMGCFALALLSKASAVTLLALLALWVSCFLPRRLWPRALLALLPLVGVAAGFFALDSCVPEGSGPALIFPPHRHVLIVIATVGVYIRLLALPLGLCLDHDIGAVSSFLDPEVLRALAWEVALLVGMVVAFRRSKIAFFGLAWIAIGMVPLSNVVFLGRPIGELRAYGPSVGLCILLALLAQNPSATATAPRRAGMLRRFGLGACALLVLVYAGLTVRRNVDWSDKLGLLHDTAAKNPRSWLAHRALGVEYAKRGRTREAIAHLGLAAALASSDVYSLDDLAHLHRNAGRHDEAITYYQRMLQFRDPEVLLRAHMGLGMTYVRMQQLREAASHFEAALRIDPRAVEARQNLGALYLLQGEYEKAVAELRRAMGQAPENAEVRHALGVAYEKSGARQQAVEQYREAVRLRPEYAEAWLAMGACHQDMGNAAEAVGCYRRCVQLGGPAVAEARRRLDALAEPQPPAP
jgi:tetratricopeptide (TPR) repeat protein